MDLRIGYRCWIGLSVLIVFALAVWLRLPYLGESLWLDELHTAWTVWGPLGEVSGRAAAGNQTAPYYWGLWLWRAAVGDSEVALRLSSVFLLASACAVLAGGGWLIAARAGDRCDATGMGLGGLLAGTLLAFDPHAIFFGTELRVFSLTILLSAMVCVAWCGWLVLRRRGWAVATLLLVLVAGLVQPTSLSVLGVIAVMVLGDKLSLSLRESRAPGEERAREQADSTGPSPRLGSTLPQSREGDTLVAFSQRGRRTSVPLFLLTLLLLTGLTFAGWYLAADVLREAWRNRQQWSAFGSGQTAGQTWALGNWGRMWHWTPLLCVPLAAALLGIGTRSARWLTMRSQTVRTPWRLWLYPLAVVLVTTLLVWLLAVTGIVPLFHRRYLVAALPLLAWSAGIVSGQLLRRGRTTAANTAAAATEKHQLENRPLGWLAVGLWLAVIVGLATQRPGTLGDLITGKPRAMRGEDWRAAAAFVVQQVDQGRLQTAGGVAGADRPAVELWLDSGLIEAERLLAGGSPDDWQYLQFPLSGPYSLAVPPGAASIHVRPMVRRTLTAEFVQAVAAGRTELAVVRGSRASAANWAQQVVDRLSAGTVQWQYQQQSFGAVQWLRFSATAADVSAVDR